MNEIFGLARADLEMKLGVINEDTRLQPLAFISLNVNLHTHACATHVYVHLFVQRE